MRTVFTLFSSQLHCVSSSFMMSWSFRTRTYVAILVLHFSYILVPKISKCGPHTNEWKMPQSVECKLYNVFHCCNEKGNCEYFLIKISLRLDEFITLIVYMHRAYIYLYNPSIHPSIDQSINLKSRWFSYSAFHLKQD